MADAIIDVVRLLQDNVTAAAGNNNATNSTHDPNTTQDDNSNGGNDAYEFVAFLLWYLFLVLCCIVPSCLAYRRRRMLENQFASTSLQHQDAMRTMMQQSNMYMLTNLANGRQGEVDLAAWKQMLEEKLTETTMAVKASQILSNGQPIDPSSDSKPWKRGRIEAVQDDNVGLVEVHLTDNATPTSPVDESMCNEPVMCDDEEECMLTVTLPINADNDNNETPPPSSSTSTTATRQFYPNANGRTVPGFCTICLCCYEVNDRVTWSPLEHCAHCFHHDCILSWLSKKAVPQCPVCRQDFLEGSSLRTMTPAATAEAAAASSLSSSTQIFYLLSHNFMAGLPERSRRESTSPAVSAGDSPSTRHSATVELAPRITMQHDDVESGLNAAREERGTEHHPAASGNNQQS